MSKRKTLPASILSAAALATICLFAAVITAQKTPNTVARAPLTGIDVKLGSNPGGNAAARTLRSDSNGIVDLSGLAPGSYWMAVEHLTNAQKAANPGDDYSYLVVKLTGVVGGEKTRSLKVDKWQFVNPPPKNATGRTATVETYTNRIEFEIGPRSGGGPPEPVQTTIIKSKSNICNN